MHIKNFLVLLVITFSFVYPPAGKVATPIFPARQHNYDKHSRGRSNDIVKNPSSPVLGVITCITCAMNACVGTHQLAKAKRCYITESNENCQMDRKESKLAYSVAMKSGGIFDGILAWPCLFNSIITIYYIIAVGAMDGGAVAAALFFNSVK